MAQTALVKMIAAPRPREFERTGMGFETQLRSVEDLRNIVVTDKTIGVLSLGNNIFTSDLPGDYMFLQNPSYAVATNGNCTKRLNVFYTQLDDRAEESPFDRSDFLWGEINMQLIQNNKIRMTAKDFVIKSLVLNYIRKPKKIYHTETDYVDIDGEIVSGFQDCELSETIHEDIVDYACYLAAEAAQSSDLQSKLQKLNINGL